MMRLIEVKTGKGLVMALPEYSLKELLEAGVHFGHQTHRWNPLMEEYIYGVRNGIHIIDLTQTFSLLDVALNSVHNTVAKGGSILFVGTKRQAQKAISEAAERSAQYYMNHRWLGGTLTNWKTVSNSISRLKKLDEQLSDGATGLTKKERLNLEREQIKLNASLGGIREMGGLPDLLFVIDSNRESLAIQEARNLKIPVIAILDTNSDPTNIDFPIPGNDDAARSISLYCDLVAKAALAGMTNQLAAAGVDIGESVHSATEEIEPVKTEGNVKRMKSTVGSEDLPNPVSGESTSVKSDPLIESEGSSTNLNNDSANVGSDANIISKKESETEIKENKDDTKDLETPASEVISKKTETSENSQKTIKKKLSGVNPELKAKADKNKPEKKPTSTKKGLTADETADNISKKDV